MRNLKRKVLGMLEDEKDEKGTNGPYGDREV